MSMYAAVHGQNPAADIILAALNLTRDDVGRFRDAFVADGEIAIYTRNGGGNRDCWNDDPKETCACTGCFMSYRVSCLPGYLRDEDDDYDCTYATIYFRIPDDTRNLLALFALSEPFNPDARWLAALNALKDGRRPDVVAALAPHVKQIMEFVASQPAPDDGRATVELARGRP